MIRFEAILSVLVISMGMVASAMGEPQDPGTLPLLDVHQSIAILYTEIDPAHQDAIDTAYGELFNYGIHGYEASIDWALLVDDQWNIDLAAFTQTLDILVEIGLAPYVSIATIDTNNLQLPPAFLDPNDDQELAQGLSFDSPMVIQRFAELLDEIIPVIVEHHGFYVSIGNEVDIWLSAHPDQISAYATFVDAARTRIHAIEPELAVGTTLTSEVLGHPEISTPLLAVSDAASYTYYNLVNGIVIDPSLMPASIDALVELADGKQVLFQEVGIPSGWASNSAISGTPEKQRAFVELLFPTMASHPEIRFWSFLHLGDWGPEILAAFTDYYGIDSPEFVEFLGTLGLFWNDGTPKPAYQEFLMGLGGCGVDNNGDGIIVNEDLYVLSNQPVDINGDGIADLGDVQCLEKYLRRFELRDRTLRP